MHITTIDMLKHTPKGMLALSFHYSLVNEQINIPTKGNPSIVHKITALVKDNEIRKRLEK